MKIIQAFLILGSLGIPVYGVKEKVIAQNKLKVIKDVTAGDLIIFIPEAYEFQLVLNR